ncbi:hypothetical protein NOG13_03120 [Thermocaproicibacter melissae]|nr:hypothetical protein [Thermocaproicibacter melissae]WBY64702.1 hypothetical protein NOG13_03120 [Thermocaproicibacter melissae]
MGNVKYGADTVPGICHGFQFAVRDLFHFFGSGVSDTPVSLFTIYFTKRDKFCFDREEYLDSMFAFLNSISLLIPVMQAGNKGCKGILSLYQNGIVQRVIPKPAFEGKQFSDFFRVFLKTVENTLQCPLHFLQFG